MKYSSFLKSRIIDDKLKFKAILWSREFSHDQNMVTFCISNKKLLHINNKYKAPIKIIYLQ